VVTSTKLNIKLTPSGRAKLRRLEQVIEGFAASLLEKGIETTIKPEVVKRTPNPDEEAKLLSVGKIEGGGKYSGKVAGTPEGDRFMKGGNYIPVQQAVARDKVVVERHSNRVVGKFGNIREINVRSGFRWRVASGDVRGTLPFNFKLIESLEYGGTWEVRPRTHRYLVPEPGIKAERMRKTLPAIQMFRKGAGAGYGGLKAYIEKGIKSVTSRISKKQWHWF